jgi:BirA family transcriptional regulator, biotin operon repressor / biotin---[acetyl-CoA-carboxylase] ligase
MPDTLHLQQQHLQWGAEALWQRLEPLLPGLSVEVVARTDSTNTQLLERARRAGAHDEDTTSRTHGRRAGDAQPCLLVAESQTRGRGRQGKPWYSSPGASLTFSLSLPFSPADWSGLSLAVGVAVAEALDPVPAGHPAAIGLKWPNDLMLMGSAPGSADSAVGSSDSAARPGHAAAFGRKLGGILIETVAMGPRRMAVIGIGLNVLPQALKDLSLGYACLTEVLPHADAPVVLARIAEPLVRALNSFQCQGFAPLRARYAARDALAGRAVMTTHEGVPAGVAEGVDADGALLVRSGSGQRHRISSGEVTVRVDRDAPPAAGPPDTQGTPDAPDAPDAPESFGC